METIFYIGKQNSGLGMRKCIVIPRKPSQIPSGIDMDLLTIAGYAVMDGANNKVTYEFPNEERFKKGVSALSPPSKKA